MSPVHDNVDYDVSSITTTTTTPITRIKSIIPNSKSKNNLFMTFFKNTDSIVKSSSQYIIKQTADDIYNENYWSLMFPSAAYFHVYNNVLGDVFAMVYNNNLKNEKHTYLSTFIISKHGCSINPEIHIKEDSKYYPAIENLNPELKSSKVRKALAISLLKTFADLNEDIINSLYKQADLPNSTFDWDETQAGLLASEMTLIDTKSPIELGSYLYELGYLTQNLSTASYVVDVVYTDEQNNDILSERNNALAFLLGKQLEQLFDPLSEYSPEPTEKAYKIPTDNSTVCINQDNDLICSVCSELITVQTNYTVSLVQFLQNFVVPLRIQVLEGKLPGFTTSKLNQIFPPTIDEVTRINCIFLDMLKLAQPYGSYEILKACGTTIPYFYKAQMRHEAAIKNFHSNYNQFVLDIEKCKRSDLISFDQRTVETAVYSSLNLVKIQLIIQRLVKNKDWSQNLKDNVQIYLDSCNNTISSFANDKLTPYNGRIFTPTGKILAEIAKGWPSELQYGWLTRRVVAVFDAIDILSDDVKNRAVIIVFSDHALFLTIDDDDYYSEVWKNDDDIQSNNINSTKLEHSPNFISSTIHKPSVSDILIHSLTNETPLTQLPHMTVKYWSNINDLHALYFTSTINSESKLPNSYVRFFNEKNSSYAGIYQLDKVSGKYVTEVLARSKILNKTQSFHLFCGTISKDDLETKSSNEFDNIETNDDLITKRVYYTAHESTTYQKEGTKSPFLVLFNREYSENILNEFDVYSFITLNFISEDTIRMEGLSRCKIDGQPNEKLQYDVNIEFLSASLSLILTELFSTHMSLYNPMMMEYLLANNGTVNSQAFKVLDKTTECWSFEKNKIINEVNKLKKEREIVRNVATNKINRKKSLELFSENSKTKSKSSKKIYNENSPKKEVKFQSKPVEIISKPVVKTSPKKAIKKKLNDTPNNKTKMTGFFKFFGVSSKNKSQVSSDNTKDSPKRTATKVVRNLTPKKKEFDYSSLKPAQPKPQRKLSAQSFGMFSHKSNNSVIHNNSPKLEASNIKSSLELRTDRAIVKDSTTGSSSIYHAPVKYTESQPVENIKIVDSKSTSPSKLENSNPVDKNIEISNLDLTATTSSSTNIYVNSNFNFPMEPASEHEPVLSSPSTPRLAKLKDEPNHTKGYKDSIDLMGKLVATDNHDKLYDDDLFEISSNSNRLSNILPPKENITAPKSICSESAVESPNTNTFTPKQYNFTPITRASSHQMVDTKEDIVSAAIIEKKSDNLVSNNVVNPWRIMTLPVKTDSNENDFTGLQRSQSFYMRFKNMRDKQERVLKENGVSYVHDLDELSSKDRNALSQGYVFSPSINFDINSTTDSIENANWTVMDHFSRSSSKQLNLIDDIGKSELQSTEFSNQPKNTKKATISLIDRNVTPANKIDLTTTKNTFTSDSSSIYVTDDELNRYNSLRSVVNAYNPYSIIIDDSIAELPAVYENDYPINNNILNNNENVSDVKYIDHITICESENIFVPDIQIYNDDVDLLSDINLDKMNLDFDTSMSVSDLSLLISNPVREKSIKSIKSVKNNVSFSNDKSIINETVSPDFSINELTISNLDKTNLDLEMDTSLCSALANQTTQANMLINVWDNGNHVTNKDILSGLSKSETLNALNALIMDKSYAYLQDLLNGDYEDENYNDTGKGRMRNDLKKETKNFENDFEEIEEEKEAILNYEYEKKMSPKDSKQKSIFKRDTTDYDLAYHNGLLNSSINYLSNYTNNEEVY